MLTKNYLEELNRLNNKAKKAKTALRMLNSLEIENKEVENILIEIIKDYNVSHQIVLDYFFSFLPKELVSKLDIKNTYGANITDITGTIAFNTELILQLESGNIRLKFDNEKKCLYHQSWMDNDYPKLLDKYLPNNSKFDAWIRMS